MQILCTVCAKFFKAESSLMFILTFFDCLGVALLSLLDSKIRRFELLRQNFRLDSKTCSSHKIVDNFLLVL